MGMFDFLGFLKPLKPLLAPFTFVGKKVATAINYILLTIVYFTAFAATAAIGKLLGKSFLDLKIDRERKSYWLERKNEDYGKKESYRSF